VVVCGAGPCIYRRRAVGRLSFAGASSHVRVYVSACSSHLPPSRRPATPSPPDLGVCVWRAPRAQPAAVQCGAAAGGPGSGACARARVRAPGSGATLPDTHRQRTPSRSASCTCLTHPSCTMQASGGRLAPDQARLVVMGGGPQLPPPRLAGVSDTPPTPSIPTYTPQVHRVVASNVLALPVLLLCSAEPSAALAAGAVIHPCRSLA
jgi:hypothetical protein